MVYVENYKAPEVNEREILRYAGIKKSTPETDALLRECLSEIEGCLSYKVCYTIVDVKCKNKEVDLGFARVSSRNLAKNLRECDRAIVFGATLGLELDRLIARYSAISPSKALMLQAIGTERIESLCDAFENNMRELLEIYLLHPRFSAGYGDLSLELQKDIFALLDCPKNIGLTLNGSLLMSPIKSVTAIIGLEVTLIGDIVE